MDTQAINQTTKILPLIGYDLRKAGKYAIGACPFCGGKDRFTIKHTPQGDRWYCRQCGDGRYHNAIDFIMRRDDCDFKTALQILKQDAPIVPLPRVNPPEAEPIKPPSPDWQVSAWRHVDRAGDELFSDRGQVARDYLFSRGLHRGTWYAWGLGFSCVYDQTLQRPRPAIVIPWITKADEEITAVKYRFIDNDLEGLRYTAFTGSVPLIFGMQNILSSDQTLLLVEGEINAISINQCHPRGVSVVSFGAEQAGEIPQARAAILRNLARNYKHIVIWMDEAERSKQYQNTLSRICHKLHSPKQAGEKLDANKLLQMGELFLFIRDVMKTVSLGFQD